MNESEMQLEIARWLGWRTHLIVPNVSWGLGLHECDLLSMSKARWVTEVEIKVSLADLRKDANKTHWHRSDKIKYLWFAMPDLMKGHEEHVPENAGIVYVKENGVKVVNRKPKPNKQAKKLSEAEAVHLGMLGTMRMWNMKKKAADR
jgi:hypothetical protein